MKKIIILSVVLLTFIKSYSQEIYIDTVKEVNFNQGLVSFIFNDTLNKDVNYFAYGISKREIIKSIVANNSTIFFNYNKKKIKEIYHKEKVYLVGQYISFHNNGVIDSIGNYEPYNANFKQRVICDTIWETNHRYWVDCSKGFQDKDWFFFDKKGRLLMIKTYDKGILVRKIIVPEPK